MLEIINEDDLVKESELPVKEEAATNNYNLNLSNRDTKKSVYTVDEIKDILGVGINRAYLLVNRGEFPVKKIGKRKLIPVKPFHDWLDQQK
ncbi:MAG: helix-turn-helix domain-containing protein [Clostridiales bacterium]|nr:helix-turn-helix domain-containing protein [Clostridiales bacterium]